MPYNADLRCSYFKAQLNMSWYYEAMTEMNLEIEILPEGSENNKFENFIEECFITYTTFKVFHHNRSEDKLNYFESVWDYLREKTEECVEKKWIVITEIDEGY